MKEHEGGSRKTARIISTLALGISTGCTLKDGLYLGKISNPNNKSGSFSTSYELTSSRCGGITDACKPNPCGPGLTCERIGNDSAGCPISTCIENYKNPSKNLSCSIYNPNTGEEIQPATPTITPYEP